MNIAWLNGMISMRTRAGMMMVMMLRGNAACKSRGKHGCSKSQCNFHKKLLSAFSVRKRCFSQNLTNVPKNARCRALHFSTVLRMPGYPLQKEPCLHGSQGSPIFA